MRKCVECERLRRAFADVTRLNVEISSLQAAARLDHKETLEAINEAALVADRNWQSVKRELGEHLATHAKDAEVGSAGTD